MPVDKKKLAAFLEQTQKKYGKNALYLLGSKNGNSAIERVSTRIPDLDEITGGGLPVGRIIELYGTESAGKTSMACHLCSCVPLSLFVPIEGTFDEQRAHSFLGVESKSKMVIRRPEWAEQAWEAVFGAAEAGVPLIVVDSVPGMIPRSEFEKNKKNVEDQAKMAHVAKTMSEKLPMLVPIAEKSGSVILLINQVRDNIGVMWGDPLTTPGGRAIRHYTSLRIQIARKQWITKQVKLKSGKTKKKTTGIVSRVKVVKSKVCNPQGEAELVLDFGKGWVVNE